MSKTSNLPFMSKPYHLIPTIKNFNVQLIYAKDRAVTINSNLYKLTKINFFQYLLDLLFHVLKWKCFELPELQVTANVTQVQTAADIR